jgi:hypothetical protein
MFNIIFIFIFTFICIYIYILISNYIYFSSCYQTQAECVSIKPNVSKKVGPKAIE